MFSSEHRSGIFALLVLILISQLVFFNFSAIANFVNPSKKDIASNEMQLLQHQIDSLKKEKENEKFEIQPFNPNYISDYKGYMLGMSVEELDRLFAFRKENKFVNSAEEFQQVTKVSDSLLNKISPYFKFPDWVKNKKTSSGNYPQKEFKSFETPKIVKQNINTASKEELMKVYGIGDKLSDIILKDKEKFGTFVSIDQLQYVWGISPETFEKIKERFFVESIPSNIKKIKINEASINEMKQFPYFNYYIAKEIVTYRSMNGKITKIEDLSKIKDFPVEKINIIVLYLEIN